MNNDNFFAFKDSNLKKNSITFWLTLQFFSKLKKLLKIYEKFN